MTNLELTDESSHVTMLLPLPAVIVTASLKTPEQIYISVWSNLGKMGYQNQFPGTTLEEYKNEYWTVFSQLPIFLSFLF